MKHLIFLILLLINLGWEVLCSLERFELKCSEALILKSREVLIKQVGTLEESNQNNGVMIKQYLKSVELKEGYPYCAAGQYFCFKRATEILGYEEKHIPIKRTALALEIFNHAKKFGERADSKPRIDDLIIWRKGRTSFGHIERIILVKEKGWVKTVGFNTSKVIGNKRIEGVFVKKRNLYHIFYGMTIRGLVGFKKTKQFIKSHLG